MELFKRLVTRELPSVFVAPALIWQFLFLYLPLLILFINSFVDRSLTIPFTFSIYREVLGSLYIKVIINSFILALVTSIVCLFLAYPIAYFIALHVQKYKTLLLFSLILPSWTSFIVQVYAWFFLLKKDGFIIYILQSMGLMLKDSHLLNNYFSVQLGMAYCFLPFMILPIYTVLEKMDKGLIEASYDLGANKFQTFMRVILPISLPGVLAGFLLAFVPAFGEFAVPDLLGGGKEFYWGSAIVEKFLISRDWQSGAALTVIGILFLVVVFVLITFLFTFLQKIRKEKI